MRAIQTAAILSATAVTAFGISGAAAEQTPAYVAYVEKVFPSTLSLAKIISVTRQRGRVAVTDNTDLAIGDEIRVLDPNAVVTVRMVATRTLYAVRRHAGGHADDSDFVVPNAPGPIGKAFSLLKLASFTASQAHGDTSAGSRAVPTAGACFNEGGKSNEPLAFDVPVLTADRSFLARGQRSLFVSWRGGAAPFSVVLAKASSGQVLAHAEGVRGHCLVRLPPAAIEPGERYRLEITDANGVHEQDNDIYGAPDLPAPPPELRADASADLPRKLYLATWLSLQGDGQWKFEAEQTVAALGCESASVKEWLDAVAGSAEC